ncbi:MAG: ribonuclease P protein component [Flavobacteriales bacterium]|nr:ribonuclease P protein component [Flavobacteriales bacterium]
MKLSFSKQDQNLSKSNINKLYKTGVRLHGSQLTIIWREGDSQTKNPIKVLISVPKKNIKKAVDRNYTKRVIRESFRANKLKIYSLLLKPLEIIIIYNKSTLPEFNKLKTELLHLLNLITLNETNT